jgi:multiple sugar transport system permease protein/raffinose/stachyose/melibiose transport system permease protein
MYATAFQSLRLGYASALAVVIFVLAFGVIVAYLVRAFREDER